MSRKIKAILFTHPTCVGCGESIRRMQQWAEERNDLDFEVMSLAGASGHAQAARWHIHSVPTIIFDNNPEYHIMGIPSRETFETMMKRVREQAPKGG